ncbi:hypothetical protein GQ44DRAFT_803164 [Phaeosphaeriaceae sp. PMI808]|nr:hypothetical protein GQ44DRAFT_803164 [Phaeosphaeriaceae sp. PMI808]
MANYEELVELGFEGVDKLACKYHDRVFDHLPAWKQKQQQQQQQRQQQQHNLPPPANDRQRDRRDSGAERNRNDKKSDRGMSSYSPPHAPSYAPDGRQDYRDERDERFNQPRAFFPPPGYGSEYDTCQYVDRGRPVPSRMRSSSWSPPRNQRHGDGDSRRRRRRSRSRSRDLDAVNPHRLAATIVGGLVGGFAGNKMGKGQKYDTAATIGGAILGGIASREIVDKALNKEERRKKQDIWEEDPRDSRGWCDRCRCERPRCWCR